jgi:hypothetical protein
MQETGNNPFTMTGFSFIDETFDPNISSSYFISIQVNLDGFSFCTLDPVRNKYIQLRHIPFLAHLDLAAQIEKCFEEVEILNLPFRKTLVLTPSQQSTLVPTGIFDPLLKEEWLKFCIRPEENTRVLFNKVKMADTFNVFAIPESVFAIMTRQFPEPVFFHQHTPIIESNLAAHQSGNDGTALHINLNKDFFDIAAFGKNHLKLCNSFPIKSDNDFIYFVLFVFEQLKLEPSKTEVVLSGWHPEFSILYKHLTNYIHNLKQTELPHHFHYSHHFRENRLNRFHNLLNLATCVS